LGRIPFTTIRFNLCASQWISNKYHYCSQEVQYWEVKNGLYIYQYRCIRCGCKSILSFSQSNFYFCFQLRLRDSRNQFLFYIFYNYLLQQIGIGQRKKLLFFQLMGDVVYFYQNFVEILYLCIDVINRSPSISGKIVIFLCLNIIPEQLIQILLPRHNVV
jgi:hypothetical protein